MKIPKNTDEQKLLQKLISGDEMAFEVLFYRYRGKLSNFIRKSLPPHSNLEETVHEVFMKIWLNRTKIDSNYPFAPYLFKVARNIVIDELRKNINHACYLSDESFINDVGLNSTEIKIEEEELQKWLDNTLNKLPEKRKEIFILNRMEGLSYKEIAQKLNISENTVDTQIRRSLKILRDEIQKIHNFLILLFAKN